MNAILFSQDISWIDGQNTNRGLTLVDLKALVPPTSAIRIAVVDTDILIAASVELPIAQKDSILVRKFKEFYSHESYVIQDERIDHNLFQIIGIKESKIRDIYKAFPLNMIDVLMPYGLALRNSLIAQGQDISQPLIVVDIEGSEIFLTALHGLKLSRTRIIPNDGRDLWPEIKRSQIDFFKKLEEFFPYTKTDFIVLVNKAPLATILAQNIEGIRVKELQLETPWLEGLMQHDCQINYDLPEEILKKRKENKFKATLTILLLSVVVIFLGFLFLLFNEQKYISLSKTYSVRVKEIESLKHQLKILDETRYRSDLKQQTQINYALTYLSLMARIPQGYVVNSLVFEKKERWEIALRLLNDDKYNAEPLLLKNILAHALIKDIYINNQPGKDITLNL